MLSGAGTLLAAIPSSTGPNSPVAMSSMLTGLSSVWGEPNAARRGARVSLLAVACGLAVGPCECDRARLVVRPDALDPAPLVSSSSVTSLSANRSLKHCCLARRACERMVLCNRSSSSSSSLSCLLRAAERCSISCHVWREIQACLGLCSWVDVLLGGCWAEY